MDVVIGDDPQIKNSRKKKVIRDRQQAWEFVLSWSNELFYRQFRLSKEVFLLLCERLKGSCIGPYANGYENYLYGQGKGRNSTPVSGAISMEVKLAITLRLLAGASELDMIWYGVQLSSVNVIFNAIIKQIDSVLSNKEIFNFNHETDHNEFFEIEKDVLQSMYKHFVMLFAAFVTLKYLGQEVQMTSLLTNKQSCIIGI